MLTTILVASSCAVKKNTPSARAWKAFTARYNTYFNGQQAYINGYKTKLEGNKDNYTEHLPLLLVSNQASRSLGKGDFETTITKMEKTIQLYSIKKKPELKRGHRMSPKEKKFRERQEFNPFLKNAWMLLGYAQLQKGEFIEAASTFSYIDLLYRTQKDVRDRARAMQALCYTEIDWFYDAEELLRKVQRDSIPNAARKEYNMAMTNFHLRQKHWEEAIPYLKKVIPTLKSNAEKARGYFLLGQLHNTAGQKNEAYKAFQKCMHKSGSHEMKLNALVQQTEVMPQGENSKKIKKLMRLTKLSGNKKFLDQIYYAIGNIYLAIPDTLKAIEAYETGAAKTENKGLAYGALMLQLGDIYWAQERFSKAYTCYNNAISIIDKEHDRYESTTERTKVLDKLAQPSEVIFVQDSMRALAAMPEVERLAVIDKAIESEKKRLRELRAQQADSMARSRQGRGNVNGNDDDNAQQLQPSNSANANDGADWYFYNQQSVSIGKDLFQQQWGNRKNEDNWRRSNKSVLATIENDEIDYAKQDSLDRMRDSIATDSLGGDSLSLDKKEKKKEKGENDKLTREYYLDQLPLTPEKMAQSDTLLKKALYEAGIIEKDYLNNYALTKRTLLRLLNDYPEFQPMDELLYHLYLMELHWGNAADYMHYKSRLSAEFPESKYSILINDPYYEENARFGKHIEDSLYVSTYNAYKNSDYATIEHNCAISASRFPNGENRPKFMFFEAMSRLRAQDIAGFIDGMRKLVKDFPQDKISEIAGMFIKGIEDGRQPAGGNYDIDALLLQRKDLADDETGEAFKQDTLSTERRTDYTFILSYSRDSLDEGKLIYEVSRFNFTNFLVRNFDIELTQDRNGNQMRIKGFYSFDEVHAYEQQLMLDIAFVATAAGAEPIIISDHNLQLINIRYTWAQYKQFYEKYFAPAAKIKPELKLDQQPDNFIWDEFEDVEDNKTPVNTRDDDDEFYDDDDEWY